MELLRSGENVSGVGCKDTRHAEIPPMLMGLGHSPSSVTGPDGRRGVHSSGWETEKLGLGIDDGGPTEVGWRHDCLCGCVWVMLYIMVVIMSKVSVDGGKGASSASRSWRSMYGGKE